MARWRLTAAHYLKVPGTKYRYEETDRETGERNEQTFDVPRLLDPSAPRDCRSAEGCVVAYAGSAQRGDWVFEGDPGPDMEPLDEEAGKISESFRPKWNHPVEGLPTQGGFSDALFANLDKQLTEAFKNAAASIQPQSLKGIDPGEFAKLQEQVAALMARNAELEAAKAPSARRV